MSEQANSTLGETFLGWLNTIEGFYDADLMALLKQVAGSSPTPAQVEVAYQLLAGWEGAGMTIPQPIIPGDGKTPGLTFPADHGEHWDASIEWRYFTLSLTLDDGSVFSLIANFFRKAIATALTAPSLRPIDRQIYSTSIAWTRRFADGTSQHHRVPNQTFAPLEGGVTVTNGPFTMVIGANAITGQGGGDGVFPLTLHVEDPGAEGRPGLTVDVTCEATRPLFLQGEYGYVGAPWGPDGQSTQGTYYYSWHHQRTSGTVVIDGVSHAATGITWMDHQWGGGAPPAGPTAPRQGGWCWFEFQFDHGRALTCSALHGEIGRDGMPPGSVGTGTFVDGDAAQPVTIKLDVLEYSQSLETGVYYPCAWRITVENLEASIDPLKRTLHLVVEPTTDDLDQSMWNTADCVEYSEAASTVIAGGYRVTPTGPRPVAMKGVGYCEGDGFEALDVRNARCIAFLRR